MKLDFQKNALLELTAIKETFAKLDAERDKLKNALVATDYESPESFARLPFDDEMNNELTRLVRSIKHNELKYIVVVGIGGSNHGAMAIYDALGARVKMLFLDTVSNKVFHSVFDTLAKCKSKTDFIIVSISKSGGTMETIANTEALLSALKKTFGNVTDRLVVITNRDSKMMQIAKDKKIKTLEIPASVGGRFSVFSPVGLFTLALSGINTQELRKGARKAVDDALSDSIKTNISGLSAAISYLHYKKRRWLRNIFFFAPELESLGKWERQLVAESLGKDGKGLMPIVSIGTNDLHSTAQLYFGGPDKTLTHIVHVETRVDVRVPKTLLFPLLVNNLEGKSLEELKNAVVNGTMRAYKISKLPFLEIKLERLDAFELGYYMQMRMFEIAYIARLMKINAFVQPEVERYKKETRQILANAQN